jgi:alcohol dehydrogenase (cytochrome c)
MMDGAGYARLTRGRIRRGADFGTNGKNSKQEFNG